MHQPHHQQAEKRWPRLKPWLRRAVGLIVMATIFFKILRPILQHWSSVHERILATSPWRFAVAAVMFAMASAMVRVSSWRWILRGLGRRLHVVPATRIWCASELARYLPGVIWQVVGRAYLARPYGISGSICSVSQVLELVILLLANILVAAGCFLWYGAKMAPEARPYFYGVMALIPLLLLTLHPRLFYAAINGVLGRLHKPAIHQRLPGKTLAALVLWAVLGLLWQSMAIWVLTAPLLHLPIGKWWVVGGAYCLAWSAGFTFGSITPGGLGVREFVFAQTLRVIMPAAVLTQFGNKSLELAAFVNFLSILLRLWATTGELLLAGIAHLVDHRGALGRADAVGRPPVSLPSQKVCP